MSDERARRLDRREVHDGRVVKLSVDRVVLPNGQEADLELIRHSGASAVVPVDEQGNVLMVRQYRYPCDGWLLEVPAGKLDPGESPERCAAREVDEETGFRPSSLESLGWIWTTPGFTDEKIWLFLARGLAPGRQRLETDEVLSVERVPLERAIEMAITGGIEDGKSICALLRARHRLGI